jgi:NAD(P)-dependent dehydrogenase (short-subunit alcohol dehydrogenase family)
MTQTKIDHPVFTRNAVAVITGGASGIGLAAAKAFAGMGMKVCIADLGAERLMTAANAIAAVSPDGADAVLSVETDVSKPDDLKRLEEAVTARFGGVDVLMNNAGIGLGSTLLGPVEAWQRTLDVNLWGVIHGTRTFLPGMLARGKPGLIINTGSKQGITTPPGDTAYNISKAGVKVFTEALAHDLRNMEDARLDARLDAHLLIPGFVFTGMTAGSRTEKPAAAWTPEQTVAFMIDSIKRGDFYILCPDNDVPRSLDERRILWAAGDITENRPPLSRWHPEFGEAFKAFSERD